MRPQAIEKLLEKFEEAVEAEDKEALKNLRVKSIILRDRKLNPNPIIRELMNNEG